MAWFAGVASDYRGLLAKVAEFASADNAVIAAIVNAGSGYQVGDFPNVSGGTATSAAQLEVTAVDGSGGVTGLRIRNGGAYSADPPVGTATTGGNGTGLTVTVTTLAGGWSVLRQTVGIFAVAANSITAPGSGYVMNDILTLDSSGDAGTSPTTEATFRVIAVDGSGGITSIAVETPGSYIAADGSSGLPLTGGTGSGATIAPLWDGVDAEDQLIMEGVGSGADEIFIGIRTFSNSPTGARNWELAGMIGFDASLGWTAQPSISPGRFDNQTSITGGAFYHLRDTVTNYWISINSSRIVVVTQSGTNFHTCYLGFIDRLATADAYPYPLLIVGTSTEQTLNATGSGIELAGLPSPVADSQGIGWGPGILRTPGGAWKNYRNALARLGQYDIETNFVSSWPSAALINLSGSLPTIDQWGTISTSLIWTSMIGDDPGETPTYKLEPTPGVSGSVSPIFPVTLLDLQGSFIYGQLAGVFWVSSSQDSGSPAVSNDTFTLPSGARFRLFQNVAATSFYNFICIEEA